MDEEKILEEKEYKRRWYKTAFWFVVREFPHIPLYIKWKFQRLFRGYSDCDLWGLPEHFSKFLLKRLKAFRKMEKHGVPGCLVQSEKNGDIDEAAEKWNTIIDKMIYAFDYVLYNDTRFCRAENYDTKKEEEKYSKYEEGINLFAKYFHNLWD